MKNLNVVKRLALILALFASLFIAVPSHAAIDLTVATAGFTDLETALVTIGGLLISASVVAVTFKWVKGMIFS